MLILYKFGWLAKVNTYKMLYRSHPLYYCTRSGSNNVLKVDKPKSMSMYIKHLHYNQ